MYARARSHFESPYENSEILRNQANLQSMIRIIAM